MKTHLLAAEIASLVPAMAKDCAVNNEAVLKTKLTAAQADSMQVLAAEVAAHRGSREEVVSMIKNFRN